MIPFFSLVTSVKDYIEITHKLLESDPNLFSIKSYDEFGSFFTFFVLTLSEAVKTFFTGFFSLNWVKNFWSFPILVPDVTSAMISEISVLDGYFHNSFTFLETPILNGAIKQVDGVSQNFCISGLEKFMIGFINSLFLILPSSAAHIITLRRFVMQGLEAGYYSGLGTIAGNILWFSSIIFGWRFFVIPWLSFDIFRYLLGFILLVKYMWDSTKERRTVLEDLSKGKIFLLNFLLALTEQTCIYPFLSNISIGPEASLLENFPSETFAQFFFIHGAYIFGLFLGCYSLLQFSCWFWEYPAFSIYMWIQTKSNFRIATNLYYKILNFTFTYLTMLCAISSIPYFGLDYTITNPLGFLPQDRLIYQRSSLQSTSETEKLIPETSFLGIQASNKNMRIRDGQRSRRERWKERLIKYQAFDASVYDQGVYDFLTVEDLNYGFDRFWLRRKMRNHRVGFRLFPGPWMRSTKKQLNQPRVSKLRSEFFRMVFEQYFHPSFHKTATVSVYSSAPGLTQLRQQSSPGFPSFSKAASNPNLYGQPAKAGRGEARVSLWEEAGQAGSPLGLLTPGSTLRATVGENIQLAPSNNRVSSIKNEFSALRKFVRNLNNRIKTSQISRRLNSSSRPIVFSRDGDSGLSSNFALLSDVRQPRALTKGTTNWLSPAQNKENFRSFNDGSIYSKRWKHLYSQILSPKQLSNSTSTAIQNKLSLRNISRKLFSVSSKDFSSYQNKQKQLNEFSRSTLVSSEPNSNKNQTFSEFRQDKTEMISLSVSQPELIKTSFKRTQAREKLSKKEELVLRYRTLLLSHNEVYEEGSTNSSLNQSITNQALSFEKQIFKSGIMLHPLKYYLQKEDAFRRKLKFYGSTASRKLSVGNNTPYFKTLLKRSFYYYKPTARWKRTLFLAQLRRGFRKKSRIPRKLISSKRNNNLSKTSSIETREITNSSFSQDTNKRYNESLSSTNISRGDPNVDIFSNKAGENNLVSYFNTTQLPNSLKLTKPTHSYSVKSERASKYRNQIYRDVLQHWYYTPFNRLLLKFDIDAFMNRQPKSHFISKNEEQLLHLKRFLLADHYDTLRWYTFMQHYRSMKNNIGGTKSFASKPYYQQFQGTFKKVRHLFAITPSQTKVNEAGRLIPADTSESSSSNPSILKFDQILYKELLTKSPKALATSARSTLSPTVGLPGLASGYQSSPPNGGSESAPSQLSSPARSEPPPQGLLKPGLSLSPASSQRETRASPSPQGLGLEEVQPGLEAALLKVGKPGTKQPVFYAHEELFQNTLVKDSTKFVNPNEVFEKAFDEVSSNGSAGIITDRGNAIEATKPQSDLISDSTNLLGNYLIQSNPIRERLINKLLEEKNYAELAQFLYKGQKLRGKEAITNEKKFFNQEFDYLLTEKEKEKLRNFEQKEIKKLFSSQSDVMIQQIWVKLLKESKKRLNNRIFLKNYIRHRTEKQEKAVEKKEKQIGIRLERLKNWLAPVYLYSEGNALFPKSGLSPEEEALVFTKNKVGFDKTLSQTTPTGFKKALKASINSNSTALVRAPNEISETSGVSNSVLLFHHQIIKKTEEKFLTSLSSLKAILLSNDTKKRNSGVLSEINRPRVASLAQANSVARSLKQKILNVTVNIPSKIFKNLTKPIYYGLKKRTKTLAIWRKKQKAKRKKISSQRLVKRTSLIAKQESSRSLTFPMRAAANLYSKPPIELQDQLKQLESLEEHALNSRVEGATEPGSEAAGSSKNQETQQIEININEVAKDATKNLNKQMVQSSNFPNLSRNFVGLKSSFDDNLNEAAITNPNFLADKKRILNRLKQKLGLEELDEYQSLKGEIQTLDSLLILESQYLSKLSRNLVMSEADKVSFGVEDSREKSKNIASSVSPESILSLNEITQKLKEKYNQNIEKKKALLNTIVNIDSKQRTLFNNLELKTSVPPQRSTFLATGKEMKPQAFIEGLGWIDLETNEVSDKAKMAQNNERFLKKIKILLSSEQTNSLEELTTAPPFAVNAETIDRGTTGSSEDFLLSNEISEQTKKRKKEFIESSVSQVNLDSLASGPSGSMQQTLEQGQQNNFIKITKTLWKRFLTKKFHKRMHKKGRRFRIYSRGGTGSLRRYIRKSKFTQKNNLFTSASTSPVAPANASASPPPQGLGLLKPGLGADLTDSKSTRSTVVDNEQQKNESKTFQTNSLKRIRVKKRGKRFWKKHQRSKYDEKRYKYQKRSVFRGGKIRKLGKQLKKIMAQRTMQKWWWQNFVPSTEFPLDRSLEIQKNQKIEKLLNSMTEVATTESQIFMGKAQSNRADSETSLSIGNFDFKPLINISTDTKSLQTLSEPYLTDLDPSNKISNNDKLINRIYENVFGKEFRAPTTDSKLFQSQTVVEQNVQRPENFEPINPLPFYAGWDESLRKFVVTNRFLSRRDAGFTIRNLTEFPTFQSLIQDPPQSPILGKVDNELLLQPAKAYASSASPAKASPEGLEAALLKLAKEGKGMTQANIEKIATTNKDEINSSNRDLTFTNAPFLGFHIVSNFYWKPDVQFQTYTIDQFYQNVVSFYAPVGWRRFQFRHSILKNWLKNATNSNAIFSLKRDCFSVHSSCLHPKGLGVSSPSGTGKVRSATPSPAKAGEEANGEGERSAEMGMSKQFFLFLPPQSTNESGNKAIDLAFVPDVYQTLDNTSTPQLRFPHHKSEAASLSRREGKLSTASRVKAAEGKIVDLNDKRNLQNVMYVPNFMFKTGEWSNSEGLASGFSYSQSAEKVNSQRFRHRRIKKRYKLIRKYPFTHIYLPTGPLLTEVLPSHYLSIFDSQYRSPRHRYLKTHLIKYPTKSSPARFSGQRSSPNLYGEGERNEAGDEGKVRNSERNSYSETSIEYNNSLLSKSEAAADFTFRKRIKPKRKYHRKRSIKGGKVVFPLRGKFLESKSAMELLESKNNEDFNKISKEIKRWRPSTEFENQNKRDLNKLEIGTSEEVSSRPIKKSEKREKVKSRKRAKTNLSRTRKIRRRLFKQVLKPIQRFQPRYGGFYWPGDYPKLVLTDMPKLTDGVSELISEEQSKGSGSMTVGLTNQMSIVGDSTRLENSAKNITESDKKTKLTSTKKRKINISTGVLPRKYLFEKHNILVLKKKLEKAYKSNKKFDRIFG
uniref:Hypothetical chloroplast RF1 n=1 Tax=Lobochlamys segnis TaxID=52035 RepID=A0A0S2ICB8_9CHLO|nr:hypothetical chloroplast RF1 [Lobochlamys segnis]